MGVKVTINQQALRKLQSDLENKLSRDVKVPLTGTESAAISAVKRQYEQETGVNLPDSTARELVRKARKQ